MRHEWTSVVVDGFATGEVDFEIRLAAAPQSVRDQVDTLILGPLANAVDGAVLVVEGHADRVDSGEDHRTSLELERSASGNRAGSAVRALLMMLGRDWIDPPPASWEEVPWIGTNTSLHGATMLVDDAGTEEGRLRNRRVVLAVCRFLPDE